MKLYIFLAVSDHGGGAVGVVAPSAEAARDYLLKSGKEAQAKRGDPEPNWLFNADTLPPVEFTKPGAFGFWKLLHAMTLDDPAPPGVLFCEYYS